MTDTRSPRAAGRPSKAAMRAWLRRWKALEGVQRREWRRATVEDRWRELMDLVAFDREIRRGRDGGEADTRASEAESWSRWQQLRRTLGYTGRAALPRSDDRPAALVRAHTTEGVIVGGVAVSLLGRARLTRDLYALADRRRIRRLVRSFAETLETPEIVDDLERLMRRRR